MALQIKDMLLTPNKWSRPQNKLNKVRGIVWHWVANPNSTAQGNRNFFENRKSGKTNYGSAHYIIDLDGKVVRCLPDNEMAYHVGSNTYTKEALNRLGSYPNNNTIGIECTHLDWNGNMTEATQKALFELTAKLLKEHKLTINDIWLHKTVVGWKDCHRFYVNNASAYKKAKEAVAKLLKVPATEINEIDPVEFSKDIVLVEADAEGLYAIKSGDTFWEIAQAFDMTVDEIVKLNPNVDPKKLKVGQKIRVELIKVDEYTIKKGDTLWSIANKFNTTVDKLRQINKGIEAKALQVGAKIAVGVKEAPKQEVKPNHPEKTTKPVEAIKEVYIGRVKGNVWLHSTPDLNASSRSRVLITGETHKVYGDKNNMYDIGDGYVSVKYMNIIGKVNQYDLPNVTLKRGSVGDAVTQVQRALNKLNFKCGNEDGSFGAKTEDAIKRFQSVYCNPVTGIYDSKTEITIEKKLNKG